MSYINFKATTRAVVEYSNIRILEYEYSIRILMALFEYLKLFEYCEKLLILDPSRFRI